MAVDYPPAAIFDRTAAFSPVAYTASQTAVLLVDYYAHFESHLPAGQFKSAVERAVALRDWARSNGIFVVHGQIDVRGPSHVLQTHKSSTRLTGFQKAMMTTPGAEDEVADLASGWLTEGDNEETMVRREPGTYNALLSFGLVEQLKKREIKSLIIGGVATSACVLSTVWAAADSGYVVTVARDACGDPEQARHDMLMDKILNSLSHVTTVDELKEAWGK
ncbi:Isochorismatase-like protein [Xylaria sp. FL1777]|nr:Isochorismatase-like protein [Xylaria sp. FL1777]